MEQKQRFVSLAESGHFTISALCEQFSISRNTGHRQEEEPVEFVIREAEK